MERRFTPLVALFGLSLAVLLARLWDIQVVQHEIWAAESANLVRSFEVDAYVRGTIRDGRGRVLVRDEEVYALEFVWRDFRRGHPLGQVAMMRSLACMRPVGLDETRLRLIDGALGYASLSPDDLDAFARGEALDTGVDFVPAVPAPRDDRSEQRRRAKADRRASRARDIAFYVHRLLGLSGAERRALRTRLREDSSASGRSFLELAGAVTNQRTEDVRAELEGRVLAADERLARLAQLVEWGDDETRAGTLSAGDRLVELIEQQRRAVDDDAADALFEMAAGFRPARLGAANLARLELDWLRASLDWDGFRFSEWLDSRGGSFQREVDGWLAGHTIARTKLEAEAKAASDAPGEGNTQESPARGPADRVVSAVAHAFRVDPEAWARRHVAPEDWRAVDQLVVLATLSARLEDWPREADELVSAPLFPFQAPRLREADVAGAELIQTAFRGTLEPDPKAAAERLVAVAARQWEEWFPEDEERVGAILRAHHALLQERVADVLDAVQAARDGGAAGEGAARLRFDEAALEKAEETLPYILRDRGGRARVVGGRPPMELVLLVTRYADEFAGFRVRTRTERRAVETGPAGVPLAQGLVGRVRSPRLVDVLRQRPNQEELRELRKKLVLPDEDRSRILGLVDGAFREGEVIGSFGLEAWLDRDLSGEDGYIEWHGLQDRVEGNRAPIYRGARDGEDVGLTLLSDVQYAAEEVLLAPEFPRSDLQSDRRWALHPVGAIVLARVNGDILAAASVPVRPAEFTPPGTDGQYRFAVDRTLRRPRFQPPGSVVKPLLAAYALDQLGLDPELELCYCERDRPREGGDARDVSHAGWGAVNCNSLWGHSRKVAGRGLRLDESIKWSCNTYFAALAETYFDRAKMRAAYDIFGFGRLTGVRFDDDGTRSGLEDHGRYASSAPLRPGREGPLRPRDLQRLGNGLSEIESNVVQVARAYAGLATGALPEMRLVDRVGRTRLARRSVSLGLRDESLERVRDAVRSVVQERGGTAHDKGLGPGVLHFELAAKTGSADYRLTKSAQAESEEPLPADVLAKRMRKHTWLAGWFPAREPRYVVVVYCHDTKATASHSAVYVAAQFLRRPEVQALFAEEALLAEEASAAPAEASATREDGANGAASPARDAPAESGAGIRGAGEPPAESGAPDGGVR